jgi:hypothetical protein
LNCGFGGNDVRTCAICPFRFVDISDWCNEQPAGKQRLVGTRVDRRSVPNSTVAMNIDQLEHGVVVIIAKDFPKGSIGALALTV